MAASKTYIGLSIGILLMWFLLAVAVSAGPEVPESAIITRPHQRVNKTKTQKIKQVSSMTDTDSAPLKDIKTRRHVVEAGNKRNDNISKLLKSNYGHKNVHHHTKSEHVQKIHLQGSDRLKQKFPLDEINRAIGKVIEDHELTSAMAATNNKPVKVTTSSHHDNKEETNRKITLVKSPETKKEHKYISRHAKSGSVQKINLLTDNKRVAKKQKLPVPHKKQLPVFKRGFVAGKTNPDQGKVKAVSNVECPNCKQTNSTAVHKRVFLKKHSKPNRGLISYQKIMSGRQNVLLSSFGKSGQLVNKHKQPNKRSNIEFEATRLLNSFPNSLSNGNRLTGKYHYSGSNNRIKRCTKCTKNNGGIGIFNVGKDPKQNLVGATMETPREAHANGYTTGNDATDHNIMGILEAPAKIRVKKNVGTPVNEEKNTIAWKVYTDVVEMSGEDADNNVHCIPAETFALGLISMSVILSVCFLLLWRRDNQPETMCAIAYIAACIVYVLFALLYLGSRSVDYIPTEPAAE